ncbi:MAG: hypothetical protein ACHQNT_09240 [Bacteroidia bacterium]
MKSIIKGQGKRKGAITVFPNTFIISPNGSENFPNGFGVSSNDSRMFSNGFGVSPNGSEMFSNGFGIFPNGSENFSNGSEFFTNSRVKNAKHYQSIYIPLTPPANNGNKPVEFILRMISLQGIKGFSKANYLNN